VSVDVSTGTASATDDEVDDPADAEDNEVKAARSMQARHVEGALSHWTSEKSDLTHTPRQLTHVRGATHDKHTADCVFFFFHSMTEYDGQSRKR
jgi:hypothetical protein